MKAKTLPTQAQVKELFHYDPETGIFRWRSEKCNGQVKAWSCAGYKRVCGYVVINVFGSIFRAHRLAWIYMTGEQPKNDIDHIDGVRSNNTWGNLREATNKQNMENKVAYKNNTSGFRGVFWSNFHKKWMAQVRHNKKLFHLGYFDAIEDAAKTAALKRAELFTHDTGRGSYCKPGK
jgi:hypothetical protein